MKTRLSATRQAELKTQLLKWRTEAEEGNAPLFRRMTRCERFKVGRQWTTSDLDWNRARRKHSITINRCLPAVLQVDGYEIQNPRDISIRPTKTTTETRARILMRLVKHIMDQCQGQRVKSACFDDGLTTGRGYIAARRTYDRDPKGDWEVVNLDPFMVLPDPCRTEYDPNDSEGGARYIITQEWCPKDYIDKLYPRKVDEISAAGYGGGKSGMWGRFAGLMGHFFGQQPAWEQRDSYRQDEPDATQRHHSRWEDSYCRHTYWWRTWEQGCYVQRLDQPDWYMTLHKTGDMDLAKRLLGERRKRNVRIIETTNADMPVVVPVLHWAQMIGDCLLDYEEDPFEGVMQFPIFPFSPYYAHGYEFGMIDNLIGPQRVVNSSWSRVLDLLKHLASTGWRVGRTTDQMLRWLETHGSEDGVIVDETKFGGKAEKLEPNPYPSGFAEICDRSMQHINEIANVRVEQPEWDARQMSGRAISLKQQSAMTGSAMVFNNYDHTNELLGAFLVAVVIHSGTTDQAEIENIVGDEELLDPNLLNEVRLLLMKQVHGGPLTPPEIPDPVLVEKLDPETRARWWAMYKEEERLYGVNARWIDDTAPQVARAALLDEFDKLGMGRYGIKVGLSEMAPTHRTQQFLELIELHKALIESQLPGIPRDILIKASDVPHKDEILSGTTQ